MKTKDFIGKFNEEEVIQRMTRVKTPEEAYAVAKEYGVTDSLEEFVEEMTKFKTAIDELSEEDLEAVAGGLSPEATLTLVTAAITISPISAATVAATAVSNAVSVMSIAATASAVVSASAMSAVGLAAASSV